MAWLFRSDGATKETAVKPSPGCYKSEQIIYFYSKRGCWADCRYLPAELNKYQLMTQNESILIIGAGLSGLTLAYSLSKKNVFATVLEASNRSGGRIQIGK